MATELTSLMLLYRTSLYPCQQSIQYAKVMPIQHAGYRCNRVSIDIIIIIIIQGILAAALRHILVKPIRPLNKTLVYLFMFPFVALSPRC